MATFYYDRYSSENVYSQWSKHLQTQEYIKDVGSIITKNRQELQTAIENGSAVQREIIQKICGRMDDGFELISAHFSDIKYELGAIRQEINAMASMLDWKLSILIEEQRLTNQLLGNIAQLLRIPDSQKQRVYFIEQGLKYLKNAFIEGIQSTFYDDAFESFKEAEKIERKDFVLLNRIGQIYLYSKKLMNFSLAEEYFLKSAREAIAESNVGGTPTSNKISPQGYNLIFSTQNYFKSAAAEAYLYAGRSCYLQGKFTDAAKHALNAYNLIPEFLEAGFEQAKYLSADGKEEAAANILKTIIINDRLFSTKTLLDKDLAFKSSVIKLLEELHQDAIIKAKEEYDKCKSIMNINSNAKEIIDEIKTLISKNSYLSALKALDLLNMEHTFSYSNYQSYGEHIGDFIINKPMKIFDLIINENQNVRELASLKEELHYVMIKSRSSSGAVIGAFLGFITGFIRGCSLEEFSMAWDTWFFTVIFFVFVSAFIGAVKGYFEDIVIIILGGARTSQSSDKITVDGYIISLIKDNRNDAINSLRYRCNISLEDAKNIVDNIII